MSLSTRPSLRTAASRQRVTTSALFKNRTAVIEKEPASKTTTKRKESLVSQTLDAFDFAAPRSKKDADLLYDAKTNWKGKMSPEQYQALRRKIGGTAKDYWKDWIEEEQVKNIKTYYKPEESGGNVPYLPFLVGVVVAMLAATVVVVQQTS